MTTFSKQIARAIITVFMHTSGYDIPYDDQNDPCDKVKAAMLLDGYYCSKHKYYDHVDFLVDINILGRGLFGKLYFAIAEDDPDKSMNDVANEIHDKLETFPDNHGTKLPYPFTSDAECDVNPYLPPTQSPEEIYANGKILYTESDAESDYDTSEGDIVNDISKGDITDNISDTSKGDIISDITVIDNIEYEGLGEGSIFEPDQDYSDSDCDGSFDANNETGTYVPGKTGMGDKIQVESFTTPILSYLVNIDNDGHVQCSCPHFIHTSDMCKHMSFAMDTICTGHSTITTDSPLWTALEYKKDINLPYINMYDTHNKYFVDDYIIASSYNQVTCTCNDFKFRGPSRFCKHMKTLYSMSTLNSFETSNMNNFYIICGTNVCS